MAPVTTTRRARKGRNSVPDATRGIDEDAEERIDGAPTGNVRVTNPHTKSNKSIESYYPAVPDDCNPGYFIPEEKMTVRAALVSYFLAMGTTFQPNKKERVSALTVWKAYFTHAPEGEHTHKAHAYKKLINEVASQCEVAMGWPSPERARFSSKINCVTLPIAIVRRLYGDESVKDKSIDWRNFDLIFDHALAKDRMRCAKCMWSMFKESDDTYLDTHRLFHGIMAHLGHQPGSEKAMSADIVTVRWAHRLVDLWDPTDYYNGDGLYHKWGKHYLKKPTQRGIMEEERALFMTEVVEPAVARANTMFTWEGLHQVLHPEHEFFDEEHTKEAWLVVAERAWEELFAFNNDIIDLQRRQKVAANAPLRSAKRKLVAALEDEPGNSSSKSAKAKHSRFVRLCSDILSGMDAKEIGKYRKDVVHMLDSSGDTPTGDTSTCDTPVVEAPAVVDTPTVEPPATVDTPTDDASAPDAVDNYARIIALFPEAVGPGTCDDDDGFFAIDRSEVGALPEDKAVASHEGPSSGHLHGEWNEYCSGFPVHGEDFSNYIEATATLIEDE